ncbi:hypothetical protein C2S52_018336 [Perilla frutescens var. hirtella]|nr:hypothetical protein C2S52_018336 [Perilla frutescens var. hirtella]
MAPVFGTTRMLKPGKSTFGLELRLIRCYENINSYSMECVFHDREGTRIHVTIPKANVEKFKHRLIEGNVYALIDFVIGINVMKYKTTASLYEIIIFNQSRLFEVFHDNFSHLLYEMKSFVDVANMEQLGDAHMFDVIGTIVSHYRPLTREINGKLTKLMDLVLEDLDGNTITSTLWENHAEDMIDFLNSAPEAPVVIILQFCRPNIYRETIGDWSYLACKRCQKKMRASGSQFFCEKCQSFDITGKLRYKLTVRVVDDTGTTTFLLWDKESVSLIGKTALELSVGPSVEGIPAGIEQLANKKALFNVSVEPGKTRNYTGSFSVARISTDRQIIHKVCGENVIERSPLPFILAHFPFSTSISKVERGALFVSAPPRRVIFVRRVERGGAEEEFPPPKITQVARSQRIPRSRGLPRARGDARARRCAGAQSSAGAGGSAVAGVCCGRFGTFSSGGHNFCLGWNHEAHEYSNRSSFDDLRGSSSRSSGISIF